MIINNAPQPCFLLLSNDEEKVALIELKIGQEDITEQVKSAIMEHFAVDDVKLKEINYDYCDGIYFNFHATLFESGESWKGFFTIESIIVY